MPDSPASILRRLSAWPTSPEARRPVPDWTGHPVLGRFANGAAAAAAANADAAVFAALSARSDDPVASAAVMAVLAQQLVPIVARWARRGLAGEDLADAEADLVVEAIAAVRRDPSLDAPAITRVAWHRVSDLRRASLSKSARTTRFQARHDRVVGDSSHWVDATLLLEQALAAGVLTTTIATAIATVAAVRSPADTADTCSPGARRKRLLRARRALRTMLTADGGL